jgi:hypothetical protein
LLKEVGVEFSKRYGVEHRVVVLDVSRSYCTTLRKTIMKQAI